MTDMGFIVRAAGGPEAGEIQAHVGQRPCLCEVVAALRGLASRRIIGATVLLAS